MRVCYCRHGTFVCSALRPFSHFHHKNPLFLYESKAMLTECVLNESLPSSARQPWTEFSVRCTHKERDKHLPLTKHKIDQYTHTKERPWQQKHLEGECGEGEMTSLGEKDPSLRDHCLGNRMVSNVEICIEFKVHWK